jgi:23S rRNA (guanine745-N1)-methyltransferase
VSVPACRRAARAHPRAGAVVADAWASLPVHDGCAEVVLVVFAPRGLAELARVLAPGGRLVVLTPAAGHLGELRGPLGLMDLDPRKDERLRQGADPWFTVDDATTTRYVVPLDRADVVRLVAMGPNAFHTGADELQRRTEALPATTEVTVAATVTTLRRR